MTLIYAKKFTRITKANKNKNGISYRQMKNATRRKWSMEQ